MFACYQSSIERQFEFVQAQLVNDPNEPSPGDGQDPVIAQRDEVRRFHIPGATPSHVTLLRRFVSTTGGEYFFQPSIAALARLAGG
jgi:hypothetical protein